MAIVQIQNELLSESSRRIANLQYFDLLASFSSLRGILFCLPVADGAICAHVQIIVLDRLSQRIYTPYPIAQAGRDAGGQWMRKRTTRIIGRG